MIFCLAEIPQRADQSFLCSESTLHRSATSCKLSYPKSSFWCLKISHVSPILHILYDSHKVLKHSLSMAASNTTPNTASSATPTDKAIKIVCAKHLHQALWLPENDLHGRLRVTFSTTSNFTDTTLPVIFFCPPMFGSRWFAVELNHLAALKGVRVICPDRYEQNLRP